ncbi:MAG: hypothetical protein CMJ75_18835 [Planctomycetaceae bacterium]|nr:hypothetical protein [Planctomycetaceae bacterium]
MSESDLRRRVIVAMRKYDAVAVENPAGPGTPDVNYVEGWVELKWMRRWPESDIVRIDHFTQQQRVWLKKRHHRDGNVWLLLQVGNDYLFFDGKTAAEYVGKVSRAELYEKAFEVTNDLAPETLERILCV